MKIEKEKLRQLMRQITEEKGEFTLFGLFLRADAPDKWDLVISAPWLEDGKLKALGDFVEKLASAIGREQLLAISRVVPLNADDPALNAVLRAFRVENGDLELQDTDLFGLKIKQALIFRAVRLQPLPSRATQHHVAAAKPEMLMVEEPRTACAKQRPACGIKERPERQ